MSTAIEAFGPWSLVVGWVWVAGFLVAGVCLAYAVGADATARGASGPTWGAFAWLLPFIAIPAYLLYRARRLPPRETPPGRLERWLGAFGIGVVAAMLVASAVSPPDPFTQVLVGLPVAILAVPVAAYVCYGPGWRTLRERAA